VEVDADEEKRATIGVKISKESSVVDVSYDVGDRRKGEIDMWCVVYGKEKAGCELDH